MGDMADRDAPVDLEHLWRENRTWVAALLLAHKPAAAELEDLLQEVALTAVRSVGELRDPARARPWLRSVAVNAARAAARREGLRRAATRPIRTLSEEPEDPAVDRDRRRRELRGEAEAALERVGRLPAVLREALLLRAVRGLSQRAIAELLEVPETTVESRLARGRRLLRERVAETSAPERQGQAEARRVES